MRAPEYPNHDINPWDSLNCPALFGATKIRRMIALSQGFLAVDDLAIVATKEHHL